MKAVKPHHILNREPEWRKLTEIWESDHHELALVLGRRRVGKSFLLVPFVRAVNGIYYQATRQTEAEQLRALTRIVGEHFADPALLHGGPFPDWQSLFEYVLQKARGERFLLVIDEFPYLESAAPALPSVLQSLIDHRLRESRIKVLLSGSHITSMKRLEETDQPLYARRTARLLWAPFSYVDAAAFVPEYTALDRIRTYGIFGGVPGHLSLLDPKRNLTTNVKRAILDPTARLFDEAQHVLDVFLGDAQIHYSIIEAIAAGERTWSGIAKRVGKTAGSLSRPMSWLLEMQVVRRDVPITIRHPEQTRRVLYTITDPYLGFWHRLVSPLIQAGVTASTSPGVAWDRRIRPHLDGYLAPVFEQVCRDAVHERPEIFPFEAVRTGSWWNADSTEELDVVALSGEGEVLVGEAKWGMVDGHDLEALRRRAELVVAELGGTLGVRLVLFSARGEADEIVVEKAEREDVLLLSAMDLFP